MFDKRRRRATRLAGLGIVFVATLLVATASAMAAGAVQVCVPEKENTPIKTPKKGGVCPAKYTLAEFPSVKYEAKGVAGKPTVQFAGENVQVVNGEGKTATTNGEGNLVIGYDEDKENTNRPAHTTSYSGKNRRSRATAASWRASIARSAPPSPP
jgi:hypothetical protein